MFEFGSQVALTACVTVCRVMGSMGNTAAKSQRAGHVTSEVCAHVVVGWSREVGNLEGISWRVRESTINIAS
jgi:hypothetical protein